MFGGSKGNADLLSRGKAEEKTEVVEHGFSKRLGWKIAEGVKTPFAEVFTVTPAMAAVMLERNQDETYRNRPLRQSRLKRYVRAMQRGWHLTGETIVFSNDGVLLNGQSRLSACIEAGVGFKTFVAFGVDRESFKFMDGSGSSRTPADIFAIDGVLNYSLMAASALWVRNITESNGFNVSAEQRFEPDQLLDFYYLHEDLQKSAWVAQKLSAEGERLITPSSMTALHYLFAQKSRSDADDFMLKVITGIGISKAHEPENAIRKWLIKDNQETARTNDVYRAAYVVLAWTARRQGKEIRAFRWRTEQNPSAPFPVIK